MIFGLWPMTAASSTSGDDTTSSSVSADSNAVLQYVINLLNLGSTDDTRGQQIYHIDLKVELPDATYAQAIKEGSFETSVRVISGTTTSTSTATAPIEIPMNVSLEQDGDSYYLVLKSESRRLDLNAIAVYYDDYLTYSLAFSNKQGQKLSLISNTIKLTENTNVSIVSSVTSASFGYEGNVYISNSGSYEQETIDLSVAKRTLVVDWVGDTDSRPDAVTYTIRRRVSEATYTSGDYLGKKKSSGVYTEDSLFKGHVVVTRRNALEDDDSVWALALDEDLFPSYSTDGNYAYQYYISDESMDSDVTNNYEYAISDLMITNTYKLDRFVKAIWKGDTDKTRPTSVTLTIGRTFQFAKSLTGYSFTDPTFEMEITLDAEDLYNYDDIDGIVWEHFLDRTNYPTSGKTILGYIVEALANLKESSAAITAQMGIDLDSLLELDEDSLFSNYVSVEYSYYIAYEEINGGTENYKGILDGLTVTNKVKTGEETQPGDYSVNYTYLNAPSGYAAPVDTGLYASGSTLVLPEYANVPGYTFYGWFTDYDLVKLGVSLANLTNLSFFSLLTGVISSGRQPGTTVTLSDDDMEIYGLYIPNINIGGTTTEDTGLSVAYVFTGEVPAQAKAELPETITGYKAGDKISVASIKNKSYDGYQFIGWFLNGTEQVKSGDKITLGDQSLVITGVWASTKGISFKLGGTKTIVSNYTPTGIDDGQFEFYIKESASNDKTGYSYVGDIRTSVLCDSTGNFTFNTVTFNKAGVYQFTIGEYAPVNNYTQYNYDTTPITVTVNVADYSVEQDGSLLTANVTYKKGTETVSGIKFYNVMKNLDTTGHTLTKFWCEDGTAVRPESVTFVLMRLQTPMAEQDAFTEFWSYMFTLLGADSNTANQSLLYLKQLLTVLSNSTTDCGELSASKLGFSGETEVDNLILALVSGVDSSSLSSLKTLLSAVGIDYTTLATYSTLIDLDYIGYATMTKEEHATFSASASYQGKSLIDFSEISTQVAELCQNMVSEYGYEADDYTLWGKDYYYEDGEDAEEYGCAVYEEWQMVLDDYETFPYGEYDENGTWQSYEYFVVYEIVDQYIASTYQSVYSGLTAVNMYCGSKHTISYELFDDSAKIGQKTKFTTDNNSYAYGETVQLAELPEAVAGYTFVGWYYDGEYVGSSFTMPNCDAVLKGKWVECDAEPVTVSFSGKQYYTGNGKNSTDLTEGLFEYKFESLNPDSEGYIINGRPYMQEGGDIDLCDVTFVEEGNYVFMVSTVEDPYMNVSFDKDYVIVKVKVTRDFNSLVANCTYTKANKSVDGIEFTNVFTGEEVLPEYLTASITWNDDSDEAGKRPAAVEINIYENGILYTKRILTEQNSWEFKFIPKDDEDVIYTIVQVDDITGYSTTYNQSTLTIVNKYVKPELNTTEHYAFVVGYEDGSIRPENNITRAEACTIFFRLMTDETRMTYYSTSNIYGDVNEGDWYNTAISTLYNAGILDGLDEILEEDKNGNLLFDPEADITRAEFACIACSFADYTSVKYKSGFKDVSGHWAAVYIEYATYKNWIFGDGDGKFRPDDTILRAECFALVNRILERGVDAEGILSYAAKYSDLSESAWYYYDVMEATHSHAYVRGNNLNTAQTFNYEIWTGILPNRDWAALEIQNN